MPEKLLEVYARRGYRSVDGWLSQLDIALFRCINAYQISHNVQGGFCEIGVHHGKRFIVFYLCLREDERAVAIDVFDRQELNYDQSGRGEREAFLDNLRRHAGGSSRVQVLSRDSATITAAEVITVGSGSMRIFSVDGSHTAKMTHNDLEIACGSLAPGGSIVLDDYFNEGWPGVSEGACRFFMDGKFTTASVVPFAIFSTKIMFTQRPHASAYRRFLAHHFHGVEARETELFGCPVTHYAARPSSLVGRLIHTRLGNRLKNSSFGVLARKLIRR